MADGKPARWTKHRKIALAIAPEYRIPGLEPDDVRQEALVALWEACGDHDEKKGPFPAFARLVIHRRLRDLLQAATRLKRTAEFDHETEVLTPELERTIVARETLREALVDPGIRRRQKDRDRKRRERAGA